MEPNLRKRGVSRLLQIMISEAVHLIWVLRCERVIQEKTHTPEEVKARWFKAINRRLTDDKITATVIRKRINPSPSLWRQPGRMLWPRPPIYPLSGSMTVRI